MTGHLGKQFPPEGPDSHSHLETGRYDERVERCLKEVGFSLRTDEYQILCGKYGSLLQQRLSAPDGPLIFGRSGDDQKATHIALEILREIEHKEDEALLSGTTFNVGEVKSSNNILGQVVLLRHSGSTDRPAVTQQPETQRSEKIPKEKWNSVKYYRLLRERLSAPDGAKAFELTGKNGTAHDLALELLAELDARSDNDLVPGTNYTVAQSKSSNDVFGKILYDRYVGR